VEEEILGMTFPLDRFYHRGHTWARVEPDGTVTVGLDDLGQRLLGVPDAVDLPQPGARLSVNGTAFRVHKRDANVRVLSPVDGEVVETATPGADWYLRVKTPGQGTTATHALHRSRRSRHAGGRRRAGERHRRGVSGSELGRGLRRDVFGAVATPP
jgi:hypothetical protein